MLPSYFTVSTFARVQRASANLNDNVALVLLSLLLHHSPPPVLDFLTVVKFLDPSIIERRVRVPSAVRPQPRSPRHGRIRLAMMERVGQRLINGPS
jgi:hypothetical protein